MLFKILSLIVILSSLLVVTAVNSIHSVFFLVVVFLCSAILLFLLKIEFLSLLLVLVYLGAIAVLFLFVVMMLNIKTSNIRSTSDRSLYYYFIIVTAIITFSFFGEYNSLYSLYLSSSLYNLKPTMAYIDWFSLYEKKSQLNYLALVLYTEYFVYVLLAGTILLVAMIGAIVLTLSFLPKAKHQIVFKQLQREKTNAVYNIRSAHEHPI